MCPDVHADHGVGCSADVWPGTDPSDCLPAGNPIPGVNVFDLLELLEHWGQAGPTAAIAAPLDTTDVFDLLALLTNWGSNGPGANIAEPTDVINVFDLLAMLAAWGDC